MDIRIRKLTSALLEDYINFFENVAHEDCYCTCYCSENQAGIDFQSRDFRRKSAIQYIKDGKIEGYLAYYNNQVVGWCNANNKTDCLLCEGWMRMLSDVNKSDTMDEEKRIKSIFCFIIAPNMRRKGIATKLLDFVCRDATKDGFDIVEAYPNKQFQDIYLDHMGPIELYKKNNFVPYQTLEDKIVMRKDLK